MNMLALSPLPSPRIGEAEGATTPAVDDFVDEQVAMSLARGPVIIRQRPLAEDLALPSDEMDFAGWNLPPAPRATRPTPAAHFTSEAPAPDFQAAGRRPEPPMMEDPGIGEPHRGGHRWWLAGLAGAVSTGLFTVLLLTLSARSIPLSEEVIFAPAKPRMNPRATVPPTDAVDPRTTAPELTRVSETR